MINYDLSKAFNSDLSYFKFFNIHPKGKKVGDCVKRAIALATDTPYMEIQRELNKYKKVSGQEKFNSNKNWEPFVVKVVKGQKISFPAKTGERRMYIEEFCKTYPEGRYIIRMAGHLTCVVDGCCYDTWDCTEKCVYKAYRVG